MPNVRSTSSITPAGMGHPRDAHPQRRGRSSCGRDGEQRDVHRRDTFEHGDPVPLDHLEHAAGTRSAGRGSSSRRTGRTGRGCWTARRRGTAAGRRSPRRRPDPNRRPGCGVHEQPKRPSCAFGRLAAPSWSITAVSPGSHWCRGGGPDTGTSSSLEGASDGGVRHPGRVEHHDVRHSRIGGTLAASSATLPGDEHPCVAVAQDVGGLSGLEQHVHRDDDAPGLQDAGRPGTGARRGSFERPCPRGRDLRPGARRRSGRRRHRVRRRSAGGRRTGRQPCPTGPRRFAQHHREVQGHGVRPPLTGPGGAGG